jgi:H+/Cl- antiporter ClcA
MNDDFLGDRVRRQKWGRRERLTPREEIGLRVVVLSVWLIICLVLLVLGAVTAPFHAESHGIPGTATFTFCQAEHTCQGSFRADDRRDTEQYVVFYSPGADVHETVHGRLVDPSSTTFYADGVEASPWWFFAVFVILSIGFVVGSWRTYVRWRRGKAILRIDP